MTEVPAFARRVLVAERDHAVRTMLGAVLTDNGYHVRTAATVARAVALLERAPFDLVLTGTFTARRRDALHQPAPILSAAGATPVVLLTTHPLSRTDAQAVGFHDLLHQPFDLDTLDDRLVCWLA